MGQTGLNSQIPLFWWVCGFVWWSGTDEASPPTKPSFLEYFERKEKEASSPNGGRGGSGEECKVLSDADLELVSATPARRLSNIEKVSDHVPKGKTSLCLRGGKKITKFDSRLANNDHFHERSVCHWVTSLTAVCVAAAFSGEFVVGGGPACASGRLGPADGARNGGDPTALSSQEETHLGRHRGQEEATATQQLVTPPPPEVTQPHALGAGRSVNMN